MSFYMMHPVHHYEQQVDSITSIHVPRVGDRILIKVDDPTKRDYVRVVAISWMHPAPGSTSFGKEGPLVDILVESAPKFWREADDVVIPDDEE